MSKISKRVLALLISMSMLLVAMPLTAYAEIGPGFVNGGSTGAAGGEASQEQAAVQQAAAVSEIERKVQAAGLDAGGDCCIVDPVLGVTPMFYYQFRGGNNAPLVDGVPSTTTQYEFCADGFSKLYGDHAGVGRYYYRVYSDQHGWSAWCNSKEPTNTNDDGVKVCAVQIRNKGYCNTLGDLYYKVVLSDGTALGWAKNGQITGSMGKGTFIVALAVTMVPKGSAAPGSTANVMIGNQEGVNASGTYTTFDGRSYTGWGWLNDKQYYFIDNQPATGWHVVDGYKYYFNEDGSICKDLEPIMGLTGDYQIKYNKSTRTLYVMANDPDGGGHIIPYKTFMSSCGPDTPLGTFSTYAKYDWKYMHGTDDGSGDIYCQKLTRFYQGFLMHSLLYYRSPNAFTLDAINYNYIDDAASGGCIRLRAGDANWIYNNVPLHTPITVYENLYQKGPVEKDAIDQVIPREQNWDPTDPEALAAIAAGEAAAAAQAEADAQAQAALEQAAADDAALGITETE